MKNYDVQYYNYDKTLLNFEKLITKLFKIDELSNIHKLLETTDLKLFSNETDDSTILHSIFYKKLNSDWKEFMDMYKQLIQTVVMDIYDVDTLIYQSMPTFRVQLPNNIAVGGNDTDDKDRYGWHKDSDPQYNHPITEKNFILPLTNSTETASVYVETFPNSNIFNPVNMKSGQLINFCGAECIHGNKPNITGKSRVSFDFRVMLKDDYDNTTAKNSKLTNKKFVIGDYYNIINR